MSRNRGVVYVAPGKVEVRDIDDAKLQAPDGRRIEHAVILKVISTNICGSDQHMVRGRTTAAPGLVLGHEITGEVIEKGCDVEMLEIGDIVSVPFNVACGRCRTCKSQDTGVCLTVNPERAGGAYGYVDMGGWIGGQARYVTVPYADFNLLKLPDRDRALSKIREPDHALRHPADRVPRRDDGWGGRRFDRLCRGCGPGPGWPPPPRRASWARRS
ncbi:Glutathione-independent formaldehyde dehydrogenase [Sphingomonas paucimobilis]|nr:Glutathione-independent formaldehyde dehydrogenase [Sphingomonas paucimobilis]